MVNGIENQISINRTAEYAKQTADRVYQAENAKAFAAHIEQEKTVRDMQSIVETEHSENKRIHKDKEQDSQSGGGAGGSNGHDSGELEEEVLTVAPSDTLGKEIDITI